MLTNTKRGAQIKKVLLILALACFLTIPAFSQERDEEAITITAYYPSPFGIFNNLLVRNSQAIGDMNGDNIVDINDLPPDLSGQLPVVGHLSIKGHVGIGGHPDAGFALIINDLWSQNPDGWNVAGLLINNPRANSYSVIHMTAGAYGSPEHQNWAIAVSSLGVGSEHFRICEVTGPAACDTRLMIMPGGDVGIGTTAPEGKLDVKGGIVYTERFVIRKRAANPTDVKEGELWLIE